MRVIVDSILEALAPTRCAGCDMPGELICDPCRTKLPLIERDYACPSCGAPYGWLTCTECWQHEFEVAEIRCLALLEPPLSRCITIFKDGGERRLAQPLAGLVAEVAGDLLGWATVVVPVPASRSAVRRRGFDHAMEIAKGIGVVGGLPVIQPLVHSSDRDQRDLGRADRFANVAGRFDCPEPLSAGAHVLLVDDVVTTGATADAATHALLEGGAEEVRACVLARTW